MPKVFGKNLPKNAGDWHRYARKAGVESKSLKSCNNLKSGSSVSEEQYLLFRTLVPECREKFDYTVCRLDQYLGAADTGIQTAEFASYLAAIPGFPTVAHPPASELVLDTQLEVIEGLKEENKDNSLADSDETSVNSGLINFLKFITNQYQPCRLTWRSRRIPLKGSFGKVVIDGKEVVREYTAITDGQLQNQGTHQIRALIECKRNPRKDHEPQVTMQEVAQIIAWIKQHPPDPEIEEEKLMRALISGDGHELYISLFQFSRNWLRYLNGGSIAQAGFATMQRYGRWKLHEPRHMKEFARAALCLVIYFQQNPGY